MSEGSRYVLLSRVGLQEGIDNASSYIVLRISLYILLSRVGLQEGVENTRQRADLMHICGERAHFRCLQCGSAGGCGKYPPESRSYAYLR